MQKWGEIMKWYQDQYATLSTISLSLSINNNYRPINIHLIHISPPKMNCTNRIIVNVYPDDIKMLLPWAKIYLYFADKMPRRGTVDSVIQRTYSACLVFFCREQFKNSVWYCELPWSAELRSYNENRFVVILYVTRAPRLG